MVDSNLDKNGQPAVPPHQAENRAVLSSVAGVMLGPMGTTLSNAAQLGAHTIGIDTDAALEKVRTTIASGVQTVKDLAVLAPPDESTPRGLKIKTLRDQYKDLSEDPDAAKLLQEAKASPELALLAKEQLHIDVHGSQIDTLREINGLTDEQLDERSKKLSDLKSSGILQDLAKKSPQALNEYASSYASGSAFAADLESFMKPMKDLENGGIMGIFSGHGLDGFKNVDFGKLLKDFVKMLTHGLSSGIHNIGDMDMLKSTGGGLLAGVISNPTVASSLTPPKDDPKTPPAPGVSFAPAPVS